MRHIFHHGELFGRVLLLYAGHVRIFFHAILHSVWAWFFFSGLSLAVSSKTIQIAAAFLPTRIRDCITHFAWKEMHFCFCYQNTYLFDSSCEVVPRIRGYCTYAYKRRRKGLSVDALRSYILGTSLSGNDIRRFQPPLSLHILCRVSGRGNLFPPPLSSHPPTITLD